MTGNGLPDGTPQATDAPAADGVTHFKLEFARASPPAWGQVAELCEWRDRLHALGLVGQTPLRYGGVGFGNLSARHPHRPGAFVITGTQTGARTQLGPHDFAIVTQVDIGANTVRAHGGTAPSSEAMKRSWRRWRSSRTMLSTQSTAASREPRVTGCTRCRLDDG